LARAARSNAAKTKRNSSEDAAASSGNFELRSLQERFEKNRRYKAEPELLLHLYEQMLLIRRFEEKAGQLYGLGLIGGFCHLYIGQEAVAVGLQSALQEGKDSVITGYRDHGHMLAYGIDPKIIMAELTGRQAGKRGSDGQFPPDTINALVEKKLESYASLRHRFAAENGKMSGKETPS